MPKLVPIAASIATVFDRFGNTRATTGLPLQRREVLRVGDRASEPRYTASPGTASDLEALVAELDGLGCDFRIRCVLRPNKEQEELFRKYDAWRTAGRPAPGSARFDSRTMRTDAASPPNRSHHGWGGAMDIGLSNLTFASGEQGDAALRRFWTIAAKHGFTPIISRPEMNRSEAWHFDHFGPLRAVRDLFEANADKDPAYASASGHAAEVGCILMGTHTGTLQNERLVQARLLLAGFFVGLPDGKIGPKTRAGLKAAGLEFPAGTTAATMLGKLDELGVGAKELAAL